MSTKEIVLPITKVPASAKSPTNLVIFSKPKVGKTTLFAGLEGCLTLDLQKGASFIDSVKIEAGSIADIKAIGKAIKENGYPYKYIAVDTMTDLEDMCVPYAEELYSKSSMGVNWFSNDPVKGGKLRYGSIINLPDGAGYFWLRQAFGKITDYIKTWAPRTIFSCHIKDVLLGKETNEFNALDLDLTGKIKRIVTSQSDAIGYLYRKGNQNILSFKTNDTVTCGARPEHLRNKDIVISKMTEEGIESDWSQIYVD